MKWSVVLSLIIHLAILGVMHWVGRWTLFRDQPTRPPFVVQLERGRGGLPLASTKKNPGKKLNRQRDQNTTSRSQPNLGLTPDSLSGSNSQGKSHSTQEGNDGYDVANRMGLEQEGKLYPFFDSLWHKVDSILTYPSDLAQQRLKGNVTVQLVVDRRGVFTGEIRAVNGAEPMLNAFVLTTLVHALRNPLPENSWMKLGGPQASNRMLLVFQIDFDLFGPGGGPQPNEYAHLKNILGFRRDAYVDPALNQAIEKFFTRYVPPIIPIPGGFFIDFIRAYQFFKNMAAPTPDEDEMRTRRLEIKKEEWESLIQKEDQK